MNVRLFAVAEKAINRAKYASHYSEALGAKINEFVNSADAILVEHEAKTAQIRANDSLSKKGQDTELAKLLGETTTQLSKLNRTDELGKNIYQMTVNLGNQLHAELNGGNDSFENSLLARLEQSEMRAYLLQLRERAAADHQVMLTQARKRGEMLSDEQRAFVDPVATLWNEATQTYDQSKRPMLQAILKAQWPVELLPKEVIEEGKTAIKKQLDPQGYDLIQQASHRLEAEKAILDELMALVQEGVNFAPYTQPRKIMTDQERAATA